MAGRAPRGASELAAVPLTTGNTLASGCSKTSAAISCSRGVHVSAPYANAEPVFVATTAAEDVGSDTAGVVAAQFDLMHRGTRCQAAW